MWHCHPPRSWSSLPYTLFVLPLFSSTLKLSRLRDLYHTSGMQWLFQSRVSHLIAAVLAFIATCSILGYYSPVSIDSTPRRDRNDETGLFRIHDPVLDEQTIFRRDNATLDPYHCTKTIPCHTEACCGSFMGTDTGVCGFGPSFCGEDCTSQCDAKPECGQYADPYVHHPYP